MTVDNDVGATEQARPARPGRLDKVVLVLRSIMGSHWTPTVLAILSVVFILGAAGGTVLQTRLAEMAAAGITFDPVTQTQPPPLPAYDFTVAPEDVRPISEDEARAYNTGIPFSTLPILAARPFIMPPTQVEDYARALDCLTAAIYFEAANEPSEGQQAVAQVIINRMRHPAFPKTICGVVFQGSERSTGCQFSFTCDGALTRTPSIAGWARARAVAGAALNGSVAAGVGMATHYHADFVSPYWAERLVKMRKIGAHIFYRWTGAWGLPGAFTGAHLGAEPLIIKLAALATPVEALDDPATLVVEGPVEHVEILAPPVRIAPVELETPEEDAPVEALVVVAEQPRAPPPPTFSNPLAGPAPAPASSNTAGPAPQRRTRIAVPN